MNAEPICVRSRLWGIVFERGPISMTCSCGAYVPPSVRFCSNCGAPASDPEATRIARLQSRALETSGDQDLEHTVFTVRPTMIFVKVGYALAVITGIALVVLLTMLSVPASISIPLALALLLIPARSEERRVGKECR